MAVKFSNNILVLGCGFVARCTIPLLLKHIDISPKSITVIDMKDESESIADAIKIGVNFRVDKITKDNLSSKLSGYLSPGDMLIDLSCNINSIELLEWCHFNNVLYINASVEVWDPFAKKNSSSPSSKTLYARHMAVREMCSKWTNKIGATAVLEHGANPGLVSYFTKVGLEDIAKKIINTKKSDKRINALNTAIEHYDYPKLAQLTGVKVIHISERDTQITNKPKEVNEFVNTWSVDGFYEESIAPAEMGWGTHERVLPPNAIFHNYGPCNQICIAKMGMKTWVRSWVPSGEITGMVIRHGEAFTISDYLTVWDDGKPVYRPTVHYAYCPTDSAINSLHELEMRQYRLQEKQRILNDEIISGKDELGVLLMGHDFNAWWVGSILDIDESRKLVPHQNATTLQVACSVVAAIKWMIANPNKGICLPEDLRHEEILSLAVDYLGSFISKEVNWTPMLNKIDLFKGFNDFTLIEEDTWQFKSFLV
ncbi:MAG: homospermidine synthase [Acholeplasmataceae bacterium]|nr:homospermidine synthase [Acholeplasmataceae bacterium]